MHSFHHSRGRILFESACALTVSASCVGAWMELGVAALLPAAAASALYAVVHLFDIRRHKPAVALAAPAAAPETEAHLLEYAEAPASDHSPSVVVAPVEHAVAEEPEPVVKAEPLAKAPPRKRSRTRKAKPIQPAEQDTAIIEIQAIDDVAPVAEIEPASPQAYDEHDADDEPAPIVPLFEAQPIVRQPRPVFGRKAG